MVSEARSFAASHRANRSSAAAREEATLVGGEADVLGAQPRNDP